MVASQEFWTEERELVLMSWIYSNSFVSARTDLSDWEAWCQATQRALPIHESKEKGAYGPLSTILCAA